MTRAPLESLAGLYDEDAVWPFIAGSVSTISSVTRGGNWMPTGISLKIDRMTFMPSCSHCAWSPMTSSGTWIWS